MQHGGSGGASYIRGRMSGGRSGLFSGGSDRGEASSSYSQFDEERENDRAIDSMAERAAALKRVTIDIQEEAVQQQRLLDGMDSAMDLSKSALGNVTGYFERVLKDGKSRRYLYMIFGLVVLFMIVWHLALG